MENNKFNNCYKIKWWDKEEVPCYEVSAEEYNKQLAYCVKNYHHNKRWYWESDVSYFTKCQYQWKEFNTGLLLSLMDENENPINYWWSKNGQSMNLFDYVKKTNDGRKAYAIWANKFRKLNGLRLTEAYSDTNLGKLPQLIKNCVPQDMRYVNYTAVKSKMILSSIYKADISSAYPYNLCGTLPTLKGFKEVKGFEEPTREYPFAFYLNSHHMAIYNELDSREWRDNLFYSHSYDIAKYNDDVEDEITILCKARGYKMDSIANEFYEFKKTDNDYKFVLNAFIGYLNRDSSTLNHITAVVKARLVQQMINYCNKLNVEKNKIMWVGVDSIAWQGKESEIAVNNKFLGGFVYENKNCELIIRSYTGYQIKDGDKVITKCSALREDDPRRNEWKSIIEIPDGAFRPKRINITKEGFLNIF